MNEALLEFESFIGNGKVVVLKLGTIDLSRITHQGEWMKELIIITTINTVNKSDQGIFLVHRLQREECSDKGEGRVGEGRRGQVPSHQRRACRSSWWHPRPCPKARALERDHGKKIRNIRWNLQRSPTES